VIFFFQIYNIENLAKISTKKKAKLVKFTIEKQKFPILFVEKSRNVFCKTNNGANTYYYVGANSSRFFL
jgi:hypothetical protein